MPSVENSTVKPELIIDLSFLSGLVFVVLSSCLFLTACSLLAVYYFRRLGRHIIESHLGLVILFLGALLTTITTLTSQKEKYLNAFYRLFLSFAIGTFLLVAGAAVLFENISHNRSVADGSGFVRLPVGFTHGSVGIVIWVVTLPMILIEVTFVIGAVSKTSEHLYSFVRVGFLVQKLVQASVYYFSLRHKVPKEEQRMACSWYFKILSLLNFACWVNCIVNSDSDTPFLTGIFGNWLSIIQGTYDALTTDYRLLCCLLFLEHALEIEHRRENQDVENVVPAAEQLEMPSLPQMDLVNVETAHISGYGYVIGLVCIGLQVLNGMQYMRLVGSWSNLSPIVAEVIVIIFGLMLLHGNASTPETEGKWRETESKAIDVMVGFMGVVGFVFWFLKASFCSFLASKYFQTSDKELYSDLVWTAVKESFYGVGVLFQLYFFYKVGPHFCCQPENRLNKYNHLFVPVIMLSLLALCVSCIVDEYSSEVEKLISGAQFSQALSTFLKAAAPIHLGFALHMFLHFYIMKRKMGQLEYQRRTESICGRSTNQETEWEGHDVTRPLLSRDV